MTVVSCIVEGFGEVSALPVLLRRVADWRSPGSWVDIVHPIRVHRDRFLNRDEEFRRYLMLAGNKSGPEGWTLIVLDADDDCPVDLAARVMARARLLLPHHSLSIVIPNREFEAWIIAGADTLDGQRGLRITENDLQLDPDRPRDAKGWLKARKSNNTYGETVDQPAFAAKLNLDAARRRSRSFRKLCSEWDRHFLIAND